MGVVITSYRSCCLQFFRMLKYELPNSMCSGFKTGNEKLRFPIIFLLYILYYLCNALHVKCTITYVIYVIPGCLTIRKNSRISSALPAIIYIKWCYQNKRHSLPCFYKEK